MEYCILGILKSKTRLLVTHHVRIAKHADSILVLDAGRIVQQGPYHILRNQRGPFQTLVEGYGGSLVKADDADWNDKTDSCTLNESDALNIEPSVALDPMPECENKSDNKVVTKLQLEEERALGAVSARTYIAYVRALARGGPFATAVVASILVECGSVAHTLSLNFWTTRSIPGFRQGHYMSLYGGLGGAVAVFAFISAYAVSLCGLGAAFMMAQKALHAVLRSPVGFHDRTPSGRIVSRLTRDVEALDQRIADRLSFVFGGILSVLGTMGLVFYTYPYLGIIFPPMLCAYWAFGLFYVRSSRQLRRIDVITRSYVFSIFGEQLAGAATIRAYHQQNTSIKKFDDANDDEGRFYYAGNVIRIWLALRLDLMGSLLILAIGIFGVCFRNTVAPSKLAVVLTYSLQTTKVFRELVMMYTRLERGQYLASYLAADVTLISPFTEMNACERVRRIR